MPPLPSVSGPRLTCQEPEQLTHARPSRIWTSDANLKTGTHSMREQQRVPSFKEQSQSGEFGNWLDAAAYSGAIAACVAGTLALAVSRALELPAHFSAVGLAFFGTSVVYNVDRLRDLERDRLTSPRRSEFIDRNLGRLWSFVLVSALASAALAWQLGPATWILCSLVLALGLFHRRLKLISSIKSLYVSAAWTAIVVGLPVLAAATDAPLREAIGRCLDERVIWTLSIVGCGILANLIASNVNPETSGRRASAVAPAVAACLIGIVFAFIITEEFQSVGMIPAAELAVVLNYRVGERYRLVVLDGSLLAGALAAIAWTAA